MHARTYQAEILKAEGYNLETKPHEMTFFNFYKDKYRNSSDRHVVDVSVPANYLDETHRARLMTSAKTGHGLSGIADIAAVQEEVPYTLCRHSFELGTIGTFVCLNVWFNNFLAKNAYGGTVLHHPRLAHATSIVAYIGLLRTLIGGAVASYGYFYSFEYLYTYVPGFKIRDPSPNGYRRAWEEGQSAYCARLVASLFPCLGYVICTGRLKRVTGIYQMVAFASLNFEFARRAVFPGMRNFFNFQAEKAMVKEAQWGSLAPDLSRRTDPDTNKPGHLSQFRYVRLTAGLLQEPVWDNLTPENFPGHSYGKKIDNPYYNWQRAPQTYNKEKLTTKNMLWSLPQVLPAQMRAGALDMA